MTQVLTPKQRQFATVYAGNGVAAARLAGYKGNDTVLAVTASRLLRLDKVAAVIQQREATESRQGVWSRQERQAFWTTVACDTTQSMTDRLRASELLAKSERDFAPDGSPASVPPTIVLGVAVAATVPN